MLLEGRLDVLLGFEGYFEEFGIYYIFSIRLLEVLEKGCVFLYLLNLVQDDGLVVV